MGRNRPIVGLLAAVWLLSGCGAGVTDDTQREVFQSHNLLRHVGYSGPGPITNGDLVQGESQSFRATLVRDVCYVVAAFGEQEIGELELAIVAPDGEEVARERGVGRNALVSFCSGSTGEHQVSLTAAQGAGSFHMTYWYASEGGASPDEGGGGSRLTLGRAVSGLLPPGQQFVEYTLSMRDRRSVTIDLESSDFDTYLYLLRDGIEIDRDDDGGSGLNSRMVVLLEPGTYTVRVGSFGNRGTGQFMLVAR
jgi:hypothetical protein